MYTVEESNKRIFVYRTARVSACKQLNPCQVVLEEPSVKEGYEHCDMCILKSCINTKVSVQPGSSSNKSH